MKMEREIEIAIEDNAIVVGGDLLEIPFTVTAYVTVDYEEIWNWNGNTKGYDPYVSAVRFVVDGVPLMLRVYLIQALENRYDNDIKFREKIDDLAWEKYQSER